MVFIFVAIKINILLILTEGLSNIKVESDQRLASGVKGGEGEKGSLPRSTHK